MQKPEGDEVRLYFSLDEQSEVVEQACARLKQLARLKEISISDTQLKTLARGLIGLEMNGITFPADEKLRLETLAISVVAKAEAEETLTAVCVVQEKMTELYRRTHPIHIE